MIVRRAVEIDRDRVVAMARAYHAAGASPFPFDAGHVAQSFGQMQRDPRSIVLVAGEPGNPVGMLAASCINTPVTPQMVAVEHIFWLDPDARRGRAAVRLLDEFEKWARNNGCAAIGISEMGDDRVRKLYDRRGYIAAETRWLGLL